MWNCKHLMLDFYFLFCQDCSLFYTKRFCMQCVNKHLDQFPHQIQAELAKKKQSSKAAVSWYHTTGLYLAPPYKRNVQRAKQRVPIMSGCCTEIFLSSSNCSNTTQNTLWFISTAPCHYNLARKLTTHLKYACFGLHSAKIAYMGIIC